MDDKDSQLAFERRMSDFFAESKEDRHKMRGEVHNLALALRAEIATLEKELLAKVERLEHILKGNGSGGLVTRVALMEALMKEVVDTRDELKGEIRYWTRRLIVAMAGMILTMAGVILTVVGVLWKSVI